MKTRLNSIPMTIAALLVITFPAYAAGQFDGEWVVDAPRAGGAGAGTEVPTGCDPVRIPFKITNNQVSGSLERETYGTGRVQAGQGRRASPITGTVQPDGTVHARWQNYRVTGKLSGDQAEVRWKGECGERVATGSRITGPRESTGSSTAPAR